MELRSVCVYCGSSPGADPAFTEAAAFLGRLLVERDIRLVYGGGHVGLMGVVADAVLTSGGEAHGVITRALADKEIAHAGLTDLRVVDTMHERKAAMSDMADAFVMLPGGFGTLDEFFEAVTWSQLGVHAKPCGILDVSGFFGPLRDFLRTAIDQRFIRAEHETLVQIDDDAASLLDRLTAWRATPVDKWLDRDER